jgi:hypothetical protein
MTVGRKIDSLADDGVIVLRSPTQNVFRALIEKKIWDLKIRRSIQLGESRPNHPRYWRRVVEIRRAGQERRKLYAGLARADDGIALSARISRGGRPAGIIPPAVSSIGG